MLVLGSERTAIPQTGRSALWVVPTPEAGGRHPWHPSPDRVEWRDRSSCLEVRSVRLDRRASGVVGPARYCTRQWRTRRWPSLLLLALGIVRSLGMSRPPHPGRVRRRRVHDRPGRRRDRGEGRARPARVGPGPDAVGVTAPPALPMATVLTITGWSRAACSARCPAVSPHVGGRRRVFGTRDDRPVAPGAVTTRDHGTSISVLTCGSICERLL